MENKFYNRANDENAKCNPECGTDDGVVISISFGQPIARYDAVKKGIVKSVLIGAEVRDELTDRLEESAEVELEIVSDKTTDWQNTFWSIINIAKLQYPDSVTPEWEADKVAALLPLVEATYEDEMLCMKHIINLSKRLRKVKEFDVYCRKLNLYPDSVAQNIIFDGFEKFKDVIDRGLENVYGPAITLFSRRLVEFDLVESFN